MTNYEYWPFMVLYFPTAFYWMYLILKSRSLTFFTLTNPLEEFGQFFGESKEHTLGKIKSQYLPTSVPVKLDMSIEEAIQVRQTAGIEYPCIVKPDWGERGVNVEMVRNDAEFATYLEKTDRDSIIQEYIDYPIELGVFYHRFPDGSKSTITGIVEKELMTVTGDGHSNVEALMELRDRTRFQIDRLRNTKPDLLKQVPAGGEVVLLEPIGNHNRGTKFMDGARLIRPELVKVFDDVSESINGFYYGRFDIKVRDLDAMYRGEGIRVLEVNGVYSEPAHIYDPNWKLRDAWKEIIRHMRVVYDLAMFNKARGYEPSSSSYFIKMVWRNYFQNKQVV